LIAPILIIELWRSAALPCGVESVAPPSASCWPGPGLDTEGAIDESAQRLRNSGWLIEEDGPALCPACFLKLFRNRSEAEDTRRKPFQFGMSDVLAIVTASSLGLAAANPRVIDGFFGIVALNIIALAIVVGGLIVVWRRDFARAYKLFLATLTLAVIASWLFTTVGAMGGAILGQ